MSVFVKISQTQLQIPPTVSSDCFMWIDAVCLSQWPHKFRSDFISESLEAILKSFVCQIQVCTEILFLMIWDHESDFCLKRSSSRFILKLILSKSSHTYFL